MKFFGTFARGSFRRQIVLTFVFGFFFLVTAFAVYETKDDRDYLYRASLDDTASLARTLSASSRSWVLANDLVGLQEVVHSLQSHPSLKYAMVISSSGRVLAHTEASKVGQFVADEASLALLKALVPIRIMQEDAAVVDVAVPIMLGERLVGWARVAQSRDSQNAQLQMIILRNIAFVLLASVFSLLAALLIASRLNAGISMLANVAKRVQAGDTQARAVVQDEVNEVVTLGTSLNKMLDALWQAEQEIRDEEKKFRAFTEASPLAIYMSSGIEQIAEYINPTFTRLFGYTLAEVPSVAEWFVLAYPEENYRNQVVEEWQRKVAQAIATSSEIEPMEVTVTCKDGTKKIIVWGYVSTKSQNWAFGLDLTERKRAENELIRYKDHLEEEVQERTTELVLARDAAETANKAKSVFLANMSHELRTPLNAILGFSRMMHSDSSLQETHRKNLDIINRSGEHLLSLINDVLDMAKIESGRVELEEAPFDLGNMVRDVTDMMTLRAQEKNLHLLVDQTSHFPRYIVGDEARIRQILINLIGNAIKFTQQGGVTLRLGTRENDIAHLLMEVEDSGPGIAVEDQERIFAPFVQLDNQGTNKGTGLGLPLTRQFAQMMGGTVSVESTLGKGSLFRVSIPLKESTHAEISELHQQEQRDVVGLEPGQPEYRILIVEDQYENQLLLDNLMSAVGIQFKNANNGKEGVELFQNWKPQLIFMDRRMPVMDGLEATRKIRSLPGGDTVKIVAVTASAFQEQRQELLDAGMDDFVRKPYRFGEIYESLSKQLGVRFVYAETQDSMASSTGSVPVLETVMFDKLPENLRNDLRSALESLDSEQIERVVEQVASYDGALQRALNYYCQNFDYPAILKVLKVNK